MKFSILNALRAKQRKRKLRGSRILHAECLEQRRVLTSYIVDTLVDSVAADGLISLREAIGAANSNAAFGDAPAGQAAPGVSDTISFAPELSGRVLTLSGGVLSISDALTIYDTNDSPIIIDGDANQQVFSIDNSATVSISDVTIRDGSATLGGAILVNAGSQLSVSNAVLQNNFAGQGGAIYNDGGTVTILGATLSSNQATAANGSGGAIFSAAGSVTLVNSSVTFNSANRAGGGIEVVDGSLSLLRTSLIRNDVSGNAGTPSPGNGGGIHVTGSATTTVAYSVVFGNTAASEGGGLWNQVGSTMTIRDSVISSNEAFGDSATEGGGGVFNNGGIVDISGVDTIISDNFASGASGSGGGIFNDGGEVTITDATIQANVANRAGGGIEATAGSTTELINVLLTENNAGIGPDAVAAPGNGGGFHITGAGDASIIGGEVSDNVAAREGGGLWNGSGLMTIDGTEIFGNVASGPAADDGGGGIFNNGGPMMITGAVITDNIADGESGSGGGLLSLAGDIEVVGTTFSFNSANRAGGGIEVIDGSLELIDSNLISNDVDGVAGTANPGNGGGLHVTGVSTVTLEGGSVFGNLAASEGGGLWNQAGSTLTVVDSIISSNEAFGDSATEGGGGVFNNGGIVDISGVDTIISDNFASGASGSGGGIFNDGGEVTITDATIQANVANRAGGGIEATAGSTTELINVLLTENNAGVGADAVAAPGNGGGFHITGAGDASIIGGEVSDNVAAREGGGLWNGSGLMTIDGTEIFGNVASGPAADDGGGGIFNNGGPMMITGAVITDNIADGESGSGGGLLSLAGDIEVVGTTFSFNSANRAGGGIEVIDGSLELIDSNLISNDVDGVAGTANPGNGGGLHVTGVSTVTLEGGSVFGNLAASEGGGLWNQAGSTLTVVDSIISSNEAFGDSATEGGGGVFNNGGIVEISGVDTIISDNFASGASGSGGGVFNDGGEVTITDATIQANVANRAGGGIEATAGSTTELINVLLTENNAGVGPDAVAAPGNGGGFHITGAGDASIIGGEVSDNVAAREGGGLWNGSGLMTIDGTEIFGNVASGPAADDGGGGIFNNGGPMMITGAVITDNFADGESGSGGGLLSLDGDIEITATTFSFNSANRAGGGIEIVDGSLELIDSNLISNDVDGGAGTANPGNGGGLHTSASATVMAAGGVYSGNRAASEGGAIWIQASGSLTLNDGALLVDNTASGDAADEGGGAIFNNGGVLNLAAITLFNNVANGASGSGGAILNLGGTVTATDLVIGFNEANRAGGGIEDRGGVFIIHDSTLTGNSTGAAPGNGGALHITGASQVEIFGSEVNLNSAAFEGGGLWNSSTGSLSIEGSTVSNNSAPSGGGLFNDGDGGTITVDSSTINGNAAVLAGGGLLSEGGAVSLLNSTVSSNRSAEGGGIHIQAGVLDLTSSTIASNSASSIGGGVHVLVGSMASLQNSLLAGNFAATDPDIAGTVESLGHNLISDLGAATLDGDQTGNLVNLAASLAPLADNGGSTRTHALLPGSPAIDAGTDNVPATDQRGTARPQGAGFDIGAFESVSGGGSGANFFQTSDVNADGVVSPLDALLLVNALNRGEGPDGEPNSGSGSMVALDVNRDGALTPLDALVVINVLNGNADDSQQPSSEKERDEALAFYDLWASEIEEELSLEIANYDGLVELLATHRA